MEDKRLKIPSQQRYEYAHGQAYQIACEKLAGINDIEKQCRISGTEYNKTDSRIEIIVRYLNQSYVIALPDVKVSMVDSEAEVALRDRVLILHYFISAKGTPPTGKLITFRELPEGTVYYPTFNKRTIEPILRYFGHETGLLTEAGASLGGYRADYGDTAVTIDAFSHVPVTIILWRGDEELDPQGNVVFDANITDYLATEDITILCETITWKIIGYLREA